MSVTESHKGCCWSSDRTVHPLETNCLHKECGDFFSKVTGVAAIICALSLALYFVLKLVNNPDFSLLASPTTLVEKSFIYGGIFTVPLFSILHLYFHSISTLSDLKLKLHLFEPLYPKVQPSS
jgi:hypothetical protein